MADAKINGTTKGSGTQVVKMQHSAEGPGAGAGAASGALAGTKPMTPRVEFGTLASGREAAKEAPAKGTVTGMFDMRRFHIIVTRPPSTVKGYVLEKCVTDGCNKNIKTKIPPTPGADGYAKCWDDHQNDNYLPVFNAQCTVQDVQDDNKEVMWQVLPRCESYHLYCTSYWSL